MPALRVQIPQVIVGVDGSGKSKWARDVLSKTHAVLEPELLIHKSPDYDPNDPDVWGDFEWAEEKNLELTIQLLKDGGCFALPTTGKSLEMLEEIIAVALRSEVNIELNFPPKLRGARSRLYRRRFLQVNTRWKALAEIYTMHSFAPFSWDL